MSNIDPFASRNVAFQFTEESEELLEEPVEKKDLTNLELAALS